MFSSGDLIEDLVHNFFLETGARNNKLKVHQMTDHPAARALLRQAEHTSGSGTRTMVAASPVIARIEANPDWIAMLERRLGAPLRLQADAALAISAGHVHSQYH